MGDMDIALLYHNFPVDMRFMTSVVVLGLTLMFGFFCPLWGHKGWPFLWTLFDNSLGIIGRRLDRWDRPAKDLKFRGMVFTLCSAMFFAVLCGLIVWLVQLFPFYGVTEIALVFFAVATGGLFKIVRNLIKAIDNKQKTSPAFIALARTAQRDFSHMDDAGIIRGAMFILARGFTLMCVAPLFYYVILGIPGLYIFAMIAVISWIFANEGYNKGFGKFAWRLEYILGFIPAFIAAFCVSVAALMTPKGHLFSSMKAIFNPGSAENAKAGMVIRALSFAVNKTLGGPQTDLRGHAVGYPWVGPEKATAQLTTEDLKRALYTIIIAHLVFALMLSAGFLALHMI